MDECALVALEQELFRLLNLLRQSPRDFLNTLAVQRPGRVPEVLKSLTAGTRLHLSYGLCCAARDVACYLRTFGFVVSHDSSDQPAASPFLGKYGQTRGPVFDNFAYGFSTAMDALLQILTSSSPEIHGQRSQLWATEVHVVGIATARHSSEQTCLVLLLCSHFFDRLETGEGETELPKVASEFFPARIAKRVVSSVSFT
jgi:hypothetical protein